MGQRSTPDPIPRLLAPTIRRTVLQQPGDRRRRLHGRRGRVHRGLLHHAGEPDGSLCDGVVRIRRGALIDQAVLTRTPSVDTGRRDTQRLDGGIHDAVTLRPDGAVGAATAGADVPHEHRPIHRRVVFDPIHVRDHGAHSPRARSVAEQERREARPRGRLLQRALDIPALHDARHTPVLRTRLLASSRHLKLFTDISPGFWIVDRLRAVHVRLRTSHAVGGIRRYGVLRQGDDARPRVHRGGPGGLLRLQGVAARRLELAQFVHTRRSLLFQRVATTAIRLEVVPATARSHQANRVVAGSDGRGTEAAQRRLRDMFPRDAVRGVRHAVSTLFPRGVSTQVVLRPGQVPDVPSQDLGRRGGATCGRRWR